MTQTTLADLMATIPQVGRVTWIGLRPQRNATITAVDSVLACSNQGLVGDRYAGRTGKRHVTLIQAEHLPVLASLLNIPECRPEQLRRNIAVSGLNLLALKDKEFLIGDAHLRYTGLCHPCSRMEAIFGAGGYNALRGHGGITAQVLGGGEIAIGSAIRALQNRTD
ncbi:MOSC domain-containing protein [Arenicella xantha]|uniref:MOSC domain-containing protein YiiM n=1 Tax=Arenicella xantha TaxID=644221 RepID=A0A395JHR4_9GAMM|nr:MOSC domain-containing protein [Arenicella xantha]RBP49680.1 MOSC domain-containing protein YiiM [Arenicella xantha]